LLDESHGIKPHDPEHLPCGIELIEAFRRRHSKLSQEACLTPTFYHDLARVARILLIFRRFKAMGLKRYGFHGLSYSRGGRRGIAEERFRCHKMGRTRR
jgi:acetate kinase